MLPKYYEFYMPVKINAGEKALETIPIELKNCGTTRPLIITDKGIEHAGLLDHVLAGFTDSDVTIGAIFDDTPLDSSLEVVNEVARIFRENHCNAIIAVGGGSVIDTAKGVNIVVSENTDDIHHFVGTDRLKNTQKPLLVVPTTAGTGSEVTLVAVISDAENHRKMLFTSPLLLPRIAVLDPRMTLSLPPRLTAATGIDALTHAIEAYTCMQKNPVSDAFANSAIQIIRENLLTAVEDNENRPVRFAMANAATLAGIAFSNSMVGAVHAIGHACGSVAQIAHGIAMSVLLPHVMHFNMDTVGNLYAELLLPLAGKEKFLTTPPEKQAISTIQEIVRWRKKLHQICQLPLTLSEAGIEENQLEAIAKTAMGDGALVPNPKDVQYSDVIEILKMAF